jgi:hypothetical protein
MAHSCAVLTTRRWHLDRGRDVPSHLFLDVGLVFFVCMFFVLTVLLVHAFRGSPVPEPEDVSIFMYAEEIAPPCEVINEKKALDAVPVENCA